MKFVCLFVLCCLAAPSFQAELNLWGWGSSKTSTTVAPRCTAEQYRCRSGDCIKKTYLCDGDKDCPGGEDERSCTGSGSNRTPQPVRSDDEEQCTNLEFDCGPGGAGRYGRCIPKSPTFICDGAEDCKNGADERNCRVSTAAPQRNRPSGSGTQGDCKTGEFQCSSGRCLRPNWVCDGDQDCSDGADEKNCGGRASTTPYRRTTAARRQTSPPSSSSSRGTTLNLKPHYVNGLKVVSSRSSNIWTKTAQTKEDCAELCQNSARGKCKLVSFDKVRKSCTAYPEDVNARFAFDEDHTSYGQWTEAATRFPGTTFAGTDISYEGQPIADFLKITWTEQVCMQICHIHPKCSLALFNTKTNKCSFREHEKNGVTPIPNSNTVAILFGDEWEMRSPR